MVPEVELVGDVLDRCDGVDACHRCGPSGGDDAEWAQAIGEVGGDCLAQESGVHSELTVDADFADVVATQTEAERAFLDGGVGVFRAIKDETRAGALLAEVGVGNNAGGGDGVQRG